MKTEIDWKAWKKAKKKKSREINTQSKFYFIIIFCWKYATYFSLEEEERPKSDTKKSNELSQICDAMKVIDLKGYCTPPSLTCLTI